MTLWYAETVSMAGRWCPQTTPTRPETASRGGHLREQRPSGLGRRIRFIQPVEAEHEGKPLSELSVLYGAGNPVAVEQPAHASHHADRPTD